VELLVVGIFEAVGLIAEVGIFEAVGLLVEVV
jgi:hypothetical protein